MTTKFNQEMYAKMRVKKNEPLSNLGKRVVRVVEKGTPVTLATSVLGATRMASPATSVEEITPHLKKQRVVDKGKEKADSRLSSVWDDAGLALTRVRDAFMTDELKALFGAPSNEIVDRHIHKLVQVIYLYNLPFLFSLFTWF